MHWLNKRWWSGWGLSDYDVLYMVVCGGLIICVQFN